MIEPAQGKSEEQHGEPVPLFICCTTCQAVTKAGSKTCRVCGLKLIGHSMGPVDKADIQKNQEAYESDEEEMRSDTSASGEDMDASSEDETGNEERAQRGNEAGTSARNVDRDRAKIQPQERVDLPLFECKTDKPMMEMEAGSNVWYQAAILRETANEIRVLFPDPEEGDRVTKEWVKKSSSRIWRGSLSKHVWKYLSKGAWAPKKNPKPGRQRRSGSARKQSASRQKTQGEATDGAGTVTSMDVDSEAEDEEATHVEERPRLKRKRKVAAAPEEGAVAQGREEGGATHSNSGVPDTGGFGFNDGVGLSSKDEAQAPEAEPEPLDPLAAWFRVHFALLEDRGTLITQLEGAGPEVGVSPQQALPPRKPAPGPQPTRRKHSRNYDVNEGRCTDDADAKKEVGVVGGSDWQPARSGGPRVTTGTGIDKSPPFPIFKGQSDDAGNDQNRRALLAQWPAKESGGRGAQQGKTLVTPEESAAGSDSEQPRPKQRGKSLATSRGCREVHVRAGNSNAGILSVPKWGMPKQESRGNGEEMSSECGRSPESARKLPKTGAKSSTAKAREQKSGEPRKQQSKERSGKAGEQQANRNFPVAAKGADVRVKSLDSIGAAQAKPKAAAQPGAAAAGKPSLEGGPGKSAAERPDPSCSAAPHKRSPLGQPPAKSTAVWMGEPAGAASLQKAGTGAKLPVRQGPGPATGAASSAAALHLARKLPIKDVRHLVCNGSNSNNSSAADVNTAGGPLMLQPSDCFED